jgi:aspartate kinase
LQGKKNRGLKMKKQLVVQKYGGSSVANAEKIDNVANRIIAYAKKGHKLIVVVSAMGDTTDELIDLAKQIHPNPPDREMDMLISTGEQISIALLAMAINKKGWEAISFTGPQVGISTDNHHTKAKILSIGTKKIKKELRDNKIIIVAGFQGMSQDKEITTLGRGGSDLTAVALAAAVKADNCEIYTDVEGIFSADPRIVEDARKIDYLDFDEMLELAARGAKMHTRAIEVAKKFNIPLHIRSTFTEKEGTIVMERTKCIEEPVVRGVAVTEKEAKITFCNVPDQPGIAAHIFTELADNNINVDMIVQNVSHQKSTDISFTVLKDDLAKAIKLSNKIAREMGIGGILSDENIARVSIVGIGMKSHCGVAAKCFASLARKKINIEMISTSEISISCVVKKEDGKEAVKVLHKEFELGE